MCGCQYKRDRKILLSLLSLLLLLLLLLLLPGLPLSGKSQGKTKTFQGQGKVRENI